MELYSPITDGLIFSMQGGTTFDTAKNNAITNDGATLTTDHNGRAGRGWSFDGVNDFVNANPLPNGIIGDFTILCAFKKINLTRSHLFSFYASTLVNMELNMNDGSSGIWFYVLSNGSTNNIRHSQSWADSNWHFMMLKREGALFTLTVDNASIGTLNATLDLTVLSNGVTLGRQQGGGYWLNGGIDKFDIYNRALSPNEIQYQYNWWLSH